MSTGRERLAELRAAKGPISPRATQFEMHQQVQPDMPVSGHDSTPFYNEISSIRDSIGNLDRNIAHISDLHARSLSAADTSSSQETTTDLQSQVDETRILVGQIKGRVQALQRQQSKSDPEQTVKQAQLATINTQFKDSIKRYQQMEQEYRERYRQRIQRQFKIVKKDATDEEVKAVIDGDHGDQIFAQALMDSDRYGESRVAYQEVQARHEEIRNIEQTLEELAQLFNEMALLVEKDEDNINIIQDRAVDVEKNTREGLDHENQAAISARKARRKKIICFWLSVLIILIIVGIVVGVKVGKP